MDRGGGWGRIVHEVTVTEKAMVSGVHMYHSVYIFNIFEILQLFK